MKTTLKSLKEDLAHQPQRGRKIDDEIKEIDEKINKGKKSLIPIEKEIKEIESQKKERELKWIK